VLKKKYITRDEALRQIQRFCVYQDRCHQETRAKLLKLGIYGADLDNILAELINEGFLNEERYARSFARGKFRLKQWGRLRIVRELKLRDISDYCIRQAMTEIDDGEYSQTLRKLLEKKSAELGNDDDDFNRRNKLAQFVIRRGFEPELVWEMVNN
jgi:regulatory protein